MKPYIKVLALLGMALLISAGFGLFIWWMTSKLSYGLIAGGYILAIEAAAALLIYIIATITERGNYAYKGIRRPQKTAPIREDSRRHQGKK